MAFKIVRNDLTKMQVDAIVNTANEEPIYSAGTDTAVYRAAGAEELLAARRKIGRLEEGEAAVKPGFKLPAKYVIHAVSPRYVDGNEGEEQKLRACYRNSMRLALKYECKSMAFPLIATGSFGYPKEEGMRIALDEIHAFLMKQDMLIYLVVFDTRATQLGVKLYPDLEAYIDHNYVCDKREEEYGDRYFGSARKDDPRYEVHRRSREEWERSLKHGVSETGMPALEDRMDNRPGTFQELLMDRIREKGLSNAEVYKSAFVTKQLFSKIKLNPSYHPDKATAMRLCVGARLNLDETKELLARAGYALSPCDKRDIIFSFFIEKEVFDMIEIDIELEEHGLPCFIE